MKKTSIKKAFILHFLAITVSVLIMVISVTLSFQSINKVNGLKLSQRSAEAAKNISVPIENSIATIRQAEQYASSISQTEMMSLISQLKLKTSVNS
jgi:sensor domain CHASE-containing protein